MRVPQKRYLIDFVENPHSKTETDNLYSVAHNFRKPPNMDVSEWEHTL